MTPQINLQDFLYRGWLSKKLQLWVDRQLKDLVPLEKTCDDCYFETSVILCLDKSASRISFPGDDCLKTSNLGRSSVGGLGSLGKDVWWLLLWNSVILCLDKSASRISFPGDDCLKTSNLGRSSVGGLGSFGKDLSRFLIRNLGGVSPLFSFGFVILCLFMWAWRFSLLRNDLLQIWHRWVCSVVKSRVSQTVIFTRKSFLTQMALEEFVFWMRFHMTLHMIFWSEAFETLFTLIWFFTSVRTYVVQQVFSLCVRFFTDMTRKRFFIRVRLKGGSSVDYVD